MMQRWLGFSQPAADKETKPPSGGFSFDLRFLPIANCFFFVPDFSGGF
jgi:hypothetical protein